jgi:flavin reductase (DIM6/NTAB) family NADH-FMN oxidoreductase RutF
VPPQLAIPASGEPYLALDAVSADAFRRVMSRFSTCATVVTAGGRKYPVGCTVTALFSLSLAPPSMAVSLKTGSRTLDHIRAEGMFAINVLSWPQRELAQQFAIALPRHRFKDVDFTMRAEVPVLVDAVANVVCQLTQEIVVLDHTIIVGVVASTSTAEAQSPFVLYEHEAYRLIR